METKKLFYLDPYMTTFTATVLSCEEAKGGYAVVLDQTAFYPEGGGQPTDLGILGGAKVTDVREKGGVITHSCDKALGVGETVTGEIDFARRFDHMQQHAGDHMIASALHRLMGGVTIGLHISGDVSTIDVAMPEGVTRISEEDIRRIEADVNERIQRDVPSAAGSRRRKSWQRSPCASLRRWPSTCASSPSAPMKWWPAAVPIHPRRASWGW